MRRAGGDQSDDADGVRPEDIGGGTGQPERLRLREGTEVALRPLTAAEAEVFADAYALLRQHGDWVRRSMRSLHAGSAAPARLRLDAAESGFAAFVSGERRAVAIGRYRRDIRKPDTADVGIGVVGDWRGRGLGRSLLTRLARDAGRAGIHRFTSVVSVSDGAALALLRALNPEVTVAYRGFGVVRYEVSFARRFCNLCGRQIEVAVGDPQPMAGPQNHVCSGCLRRYVPKVQLKLADPWWV